MFVMDILEGICPGKGPPHPHVHKLIGIQAGPTAAAKGLLPNGIDRHIMKVVDYILHDIPRLIKKSHASGGIAGIMEREPVGVIAARIQV